MDAEGAAAYGSPIHARTGVGARVPSLDCSILRSGFPSLRPNGRQHPAKKEHGMVTIERAHSNDIYDSVTLPREAARVVVPDFRYPTDSITRT